ncbi:6-phosphogluconolactonase [Bifidobacterium bohemicum]|uniref:6-phosphogluconolactonase n=1 Tax=Bifidobacterium bohemicum DSM 22767 TaxID=1437606 RepID=A0A086ZHT3_9BIFI|nr:6-phosphogluconolactonase [Bifidobacterium bohemicum]KFI46083.1 glucosamine-6-phosphate isomerase [Bifidobacterium bohemicum DSM 22767]SCC06448.1 6-phosphogluconolactonase [Bifidobacterium bohemicum]
MAERRLEVYPDKATVAEAAAQRTLLAILDGLSARGEGGNNTHATARYDVGLTGGSDSILSLKDMAANPLVDAVDWSRVHFWWGDERYSAPDSDDRNCLQARRAFLDKLVSDGRLPETNIHEVPADMRSAAEVAAASDEENDALLAQAAAQYQTELRRELGDAPTLDLLILGMGPDGHFGSLFPGHDEINVTDSRQLVVGVSHSPKMPPLRVSLTAPMMARSRRTWMLTCGAGKAEASAQVFAHRNNPAYPSSFADGVDEFLWSTDPAASALLK